METAKSMQQIKTDKVKFIQLQLKNILKQKRKKVTNTAYKFQNGKLISILQYIKLLNRMEL